MVGAGGRVKITNIDSGDFVDQNGTHRFVFPLR